MEETGRVGGESVEEVGLGGIAHEGGLEADTADVYA
jgi:hypothetical protein